MSLEVFRAPQRASLAARRYLSIESCPPPECCFELLRATMWGIAGPGGKAHINRVLSAALPAWRLLSERAAAAEETLRAELRGALSMLEDAGDFIELGGGYWTPATARFVELPGETGYLLVGGVPSALLALHRDSLQVHGPHRHLDRVPEELAGALPVEDLTSWARLPKIPLQQWVSEALQSLERQPYVPTSSDVFEFYRPGDSAPGAPQFKRWFDDAGKTTGVLLARRRRLFGSREYRLVDVTAGRIVSACELPDFDARRLMYALDLDAGNPVRARPVTVGTQVEWLFTSELPRPELRACAAFGVLTIPADRPFERRWRFLRNEETALEILRALGIEFGRSP